MKINILKPLVPFFFLASTAAKASTSPSSMTFGGDNALPKEIKEKMMTASSRIHNGRHLDGEGPYPTASEVMIKNLDCSACMEAYPLGSNVQSQHAQIGRNERRGRLGNRDLATTDEVFVTALNCDAGNPLQVWNLTSLDDAGTWNLFENVYTESCMQLVGECSFDGKLYTIEMGECDASNPKAIWGVTGIGQIVNFDCFVNEYDTHSTPDVFLEAKCGTAGGRDKLDISSLSSGSEDTASNFWAVFPKDLLSDDDCSECGTCGVSHGDVGCSCNECETLICNIDPFCCTFNWDWICVDEAYYYCDVCTATTSPPVETSPPSLPCIEYEVGNCDVSSSETGCSCEACETVVCAIDSFCCDNFWDGICVDEALALCDCDSCPLDETSPPV